jgi:hypothetical protein
MSPETHRNRGYCVGSIFGRHRSAAVISTYQQMREHPAFPSNERFGQGVPIALAMTEGERGNSARAVEIIDGVLPVLRKRPVADYLGWALTAQAGFLVALDRGPEACTIAREAIRYLAKHDPEHMHIAMAAEHLALGLALGGDFNRAASLAGHVECRFAVQSTDRQGTDPQTHDRLLPLLRANIAPDELERLQSRGAALDPDAAIALALAIEG